jgi:uncharacterized protein (DUF2235 family)
MRRGVIQQGLPMKRIAIFLDGTWNTLENNTNVWRLKSLCDPGATDQIVFYSKGVGTSFGETVRGGVLGYGIDNEIIDAYSWLTQCFEPGDEIFIFGFSRGAYTARSLSGLIAKCGVLKPGAPLSIEQLYARYRRHSDKTINELLHGSEPVDLEERWIIKYCEPTKIKMVGVWDTVGSLGSPIASLKSKVVKYLFLDTHLRVQNEYAFHALAVDEQRKSFEPTLWTKTTANDSANPGPPPRPLSQVEQRWFVGAHANVGGGYASDVLAQPPLEWLMRKAAGLGLKFRDTFIADGQSPTAPIADSYHDFGHGLVRFFVPRFYRPIGCDPEKGTSRTTERINETIDGSVFERWRGNSNYRPPNLTDWAALRSIDPGTLTGARLARDPSVTVA